MNGQIDGWASHVMQPIGWPHNNSLETTMVDDNQSVFTLPPASTNMMHSFFIIHFVFFIILTTIAMLIALEVFDVQ